MIDVFWQGVPNWLMVLMAFLTLVAATFAGVFARRAAHWTKAQAESSDTQASIAHESLELAQTAAEEQRQETTRAYRRLSESRLDALAPSIYAAASPGAPLLQVRRAVGTGGSWGDWEAVTDDFEVAENEQVIFRTNVTVTLSNYSDQVARVDIIDPAGGETDVRSGEMIVVPPAQAKSISWTRNVTSIATQEDLDQPRNWLFNMELWVRDLGMNVRDVYRFNADLRFFSRDGSRLLVKPEPPFPWSENVAVPLPGRSYERLDAEQSGSLVT